MRRQGFGLLETIVAIGVITTGLFAVLTLVFSNVRGAREASIRFGAIAVAREGVEVVRMLRDANWIAGVAWDTGIAGPVASSTAILMFDPENAIWTPVYGAYVLEDLETQVVPISMPSGAVFWTQGEVAAAATTPYRRVIGTYPICRIVPVNPGDPDRIILEEVGVACTPGMKVGMLVRSTAQWASGGRLQTVAVEEELYDWR